MKIEKHRGFGGSGFEFFVAETLARAPSSRRPAAIFLAVFEDDRLAFSAENIKSYLSHLGASARAIVFPFDDIGARLAALSEIWRPRAPVIVVSSPEALAAKTISRDDFAKIFRRVAPGSDASILVESLLSAGYKRTEYVEAVGQFAVRGEITDFWVPGAAEPCRIVLDGTLVERIKFFSPDTQMSAIPADEIFILPAAEIPSVSPWEWFSGAAAVFASFATSAKKLGAPAGVRAPSRFVVNESFAATRDEGYISAGFYSGDAGLLERDLSKGYKYKTVFSSSPGELARFFEAVPARLGFKSAPFEISEGFANPQKNIFAISAAQFFLKSRPRSEPKIKIPSRRLEGLWEISAGDYVVHEKYGVGRYRGIRLEDNPPQEFVVIEYRHGDLLYVPVYDFSKIKKYVGAQGLRPKVYDLDAPGVWERAKTRAKNSAEIFAKELLGLYAAREALDAPAMTAKTVWEDELEQSFPFEATPDQAAAIDDVFSDLARRRPSDRVILGDVGFGKTEVALRAAFKAAVNSHQTAVIVPTTILAMQHYTRFAERLAPFPVTVAALHRFLPPADRKKALAGVASGAVDIIIGTHRLLSGDVKFKNLGLLIIDEEHRFGVRQKEKLRNAKKNVHTVLMSATPIPRTLGAALNGIKDISIIETPPVGRKPVETIVSPYSGAKIRRAIYDEISRGGQVFYVHNVIEDLPRKLKTLSSEVPAARWGVIHGRMHAAEVEKTLYDFYSGKTDCLLTTTIVESGLDIPQVNTMIIDGAQNFGLAQMYQLKGRVGRGDRKAFCYFFYDDKDLSDDARRRLEALGEFGALGSGWRLARRDLEIRGAGALFGYRQHGFISSVGFDLYAKLISEAVGKLSRRPAGLPREETIEPAMEISCPAFIPQDYIAQDNIRISFYRKYVDASDDSAVDAVSKEMEDRFGRMPAPAVDVARLARLRIFMKKNKILSLRESSGGYTVSFAPGVFFASGDFDKMLRHFRGALVLSSPDSLKIAVSAVARDSIAGLKSVLKKIIEFATIENRAPVSAARPEDK